MNNYYVYAYIRQYNNTPYYIGKGKNKRCISNCHKVSVPKDKSKIIFLETNLTNVGACALERRYIEWYGRKDLGNGILLNRTDGGDGNSSKRTEMWKNNHSFMMKEKYNNYPEIKEKISQNSKNRNTDYMKTNSYRQSISLSKKGIPNNKLKGRNAPNGIKVITPYGLFDSIVKAAKYENVSTDTIYWRINSNKFPLYYKG